MSRPPQVDRALGCRVVCGVPSKVLPWTHKALWREMRMLDRDATEGCWADTPHLSAELGLGIDTVRKYRQQLQRLGMLESERRRQRDRWEWHWYPTLPVGCVPRENTNQEVQRCRKRLETHIEEVLRGDHHTPAERKTLDRGGTVVPAGDVAADVLKRYEHTPSSKTSRGTLGRPERVRSYP